MESRDNINKVENQEANGKLLESVIKIQREIRSFARYEAHTNKFFPMNGCHSGYAALSLPECFDETLRPRLEKIIHDLSINQAVFKTVTHITTIENLQSIIADGYIKGNGILKKEGKTFTQNVLGHMDLLYGDEQTICFGPGHIDSEAFLAANKENSYQKNVLKKNVCAIIAEIKPFNTGLYNQYFKLVDFLTGSFDYLCKINEDLTVNVVRFQTSLLWAENFLIKIVLTFKGQDINFFIKDLAEALFYGNQVAINRFCLTRLFYFLSYNQEEPDSDVSFEDLHRNMEFLNYLNGLDEAEIKKILIVFTQALTLYSEYNFNGYLEFNKINIKEIRIYDHTNCTNGFKFDLSGLESTSYQQFFEDFKNGKLTELKTNFSIPLTDNESVNIKKECTYNGEVDVLFIHGKKRGRLPLYADCVHYMDEDFRSIPAPVFIRDEYIETRSYVYDQKYSILLNLSHSNQENKLIKK